MSGDERISRGEEPTIRGSGRSRTGSTQSSGG